MCRGVHLGSFAAQTGSEVGTSSLCCNAGSSHCTVSGFSRWIPARDLSPHKTW